MCAHTHKFISTFTHIYIHTIYIYTYMQIQILYIKNTHICSLSHTLSHTLSRAGKWCETQSLSFTHISKGLGRSTWS